MASKPSIQKNVVYDSGNDISSGRKRAVDFTGGVSVAERARLFGTQVTHSSAPKKPAVQRFGANKQQLPPQIKSNVTHQPFRANANQFPKHQQQQQTNYSSPEWVSRRYESPSPVQISERPRPEPSPPITSQNYSIASRPPFRHQQYQPPPQQRPPPIYDAFQSQIPNEPPPTIKTNYTQVSSGEPYTYDDDPFYHSHASQRSLPLNSNYFQPVQDPLEALYRSSAPIYSQRPLPPTVNNNQTDGMQAFDLGNLINRIQQDYVDNVRPYVSSVQFIEDEQSLANIGVLTPSATRKNYSRRNNDIYLRQGASYHYDIIDVHGSYPRLVKPTHRDKQYSSIKRRRRRRNYHDQAVSPIHIFESSYKPPPKSPSPPPPPIEKPATPVAETASDEEDTTAGNTKTEEADTSSEEESTGNVIATPAKPSTALPPTETTRPILPNPALSATNRPPLKPVPSETSESDESDSESESDSDEEEEKPKATAPAARLNNNRTTSATPQGNSRVIPLRTTTNNDEISSQPPETAYSVQSFDLENSKKSSGIAGRFRSLFNKIRRRKS